MEAGIPAIPHRAIFHFNVLDVIMDICCDNSKYRTVLISNHVRFWIRQIFSAGGDRNPGSRRGLCHVRQEQWLQTMSRRAMILGVCSICNEGSWRRAHDPLRIRSRLRSFASSRLHPMLVSVNGCINHTSVPRRGPISVKIVMLRRGGSMDISCVVWQVQD
jgi:hypothetical protein